MKNVISLSMITVALLFLGCNDKTTVTEVKESAPVQQQEAKEVKIEKKVEEKKVEKAEQTKENKPKQNHIVNSDVFKDAAKIESGGKNMIIIFDSPDCKYCKMLQEDIKNSEELKNRLANDYNSYDLDSSKNIMHSLEHEGEFMQVDTQTLVSIYGVSATPTIILTDKKGKSVIIVPGYMPEKQFLVTLDFLDNEQLWKDKDRKNGEIYQALKEYYIEKGILDKDGNRVEKGKS